MRQSRQVRCVALLAGTAWGICTLGGCAQIRQYNRRTPELAQQRAVESLRLERGIRLQLTSGRIVEGVLVSRDWPRLTIAAADSTSNLDGREIAVLWRPAVDKTRGSLIGAGIVAVPFAILGYTLAKHPICFFVSCEGKEGSELVWPTVGGALVGGGLGLILGALVAEGRPGWLRIYP